MEIILTLGETLLLWLVHGVYLNQTQELWWDCQQEKMKYVSTHTENMGPFSFPDCSSIGK